MRPNHFLGPANEDCKGLPPIIALIFYLPSGVGTILQTLQTLGVDKDTLVIFSSDNGGALYAAVNGNHLPACFCYFCCHGYQAGVMLHSCVARRQHLREE